MKRILSLSLVLMMVLSLFAMAPITVSAATKIGTGTEEDPYIINSETVSLYEEATLESGKHYRVEGAVTFNKPIKYIYDGVFYGKDENAVITLNITNHQNSYPDGLFQYAYPAAGKTLEIKNLTLKGSITTTNSDDKYGIGALVGRTVTGTVKIDNIINEATVTGLNDAGGLVGQVKTETIITNCKNTKSVTATSGGNVGGIVGNATSTLTIKNTKNKGQIIGNGLYAGGLIGNATANLVVENCANEGNVTTTNYAAGFVSLSSNNSVEISNSYNAGDVCTTTSSRAYGLAFSANSSVTKTIGTITNCFNTGKVYYQSTTNPKYLIERLDATNVYNTAELEALSYDGTSKYTYTAKNIHSLKAKSNSSNENANITEITYYDNVNDFKDITIEGFITATPTKESAYPYPQIDGNEYVKAAASVPTTLGTIGGGFSANEDISGTYADGDITYTGAYVAGYGIAQDLFGWEKSYGMILKDANGVEYEADAVANSATKSGNYGVLFFGSKLVPGEYTLTPYVTYTNYGETYQVKGEAKTVTVAE